MTVVRDILERKNRKTVTVIPEDTVLRAAQLMNEARIGSVVVGDSNGSVVGIFTERDILRRVVCECRSPANTRVGEVMTHPVTCCKSDTSLAECRSVMTTKRLRHLPVVENGELVGMVSIGDILAWEVEMQQSTLEYFNEYLHVRV